MKLLVIVLDAPIMLAEPRDAGAAPEPMRLVRRAVGPHVFIPRDPFEHPWLDAVTVESPAPMHTARAGAIVAMQSPETMGRN